MQFFGAEHYSEKSYGPDRNISLKFEVVEIGGPSENRAFFSKLRHCYHNPSSVFESLRYVVFGDIWVEGSITSRFNRKSEISKFVQHSGWPPSWDVFFAMANFFF